MNEARVIGLTGGVGCGKSTVAGILERAGESVLDTDAVAHALLKSGSKLLADVIGAFGEEFLTNKALDRKKLGKLVFSDQEARKKLNAIMHPAIFSEMHRWLEQMLARRDRAVVMIPLLYETGAERWCDKVVVVAADEAIVLERLAGRGWTEGEARARIASQMPLSEKIVRADAVIWNNRGLEELSQATQTIWNKNILGKEEQP